MNLKNKILNLLFTFREVAGTIPSYQSMSRTYHYTHTGHSVTRCAPCLSPDNCVMLRLACIYLGENFIKSIRNRKENPHFRFVNIVRDVFLISRLLYKRPPTRHELNVFQASFLTLQLEVRINRKIENVKKPDSQIIKISKIF